MTVTTLNPWIAQKHDFDPNSRAAREDYQLRAIRRMVEYARSRSSFYAHLYEGLPLPESLADFTRYPSFDAADWVDRGPQLVCVSQSEIARIVTLQSSGTTRAPKRVYFTREDVALTLDFFQHGMQTICRPGDRSLVLFPARVPGSVGALLKTALERIGVTVFLAGPEEAPGVVRNKAVTVACGPPSWLAQVATQTPGAAIRAVLSSSDSLLPFHRARLTESWYCQIFDHYGMTETGLGGAVECQAHAGMHIRENDLYLETLASDGSPLPDGAVGQLAITTLTRTGMPFLRYRTGDTGCIECGICPCGSGLRRIRYVSRMETLEKKLEP